MTTRLQASWIRSATLVVMLLAGGLLAQDTPASEDGHRFVSVGQLASVRGQDAKSKRFVLLDEYGEVVCSLRPAAGIDLKEFLGQEVGITARTLVDGDTPILLAENVTTFGEARQISTDDVQTHVALASHEEDEDGVLPTPILESTPSIGDEYPITSYDVPLAVGSTLVGPGCGIDGCASCGGGCGNASCASCAACPCGLPGRFWIRSEYLIWWTDGMDTPALVTTSPAGTARQNAGVLGAPGTQVLFGDEALFSDSRSGARFRIGRWCDDCNWVGFETDFFFLSDEDQNYRDSSFGQPTLARPFFNVLTGTNDAELVQLPGTVIGGLEVDADTSLWSISPRLRVNLACERFLDGGGRDPCAMGGYRFDLLVGYRYMGLDDSLRVRERLVTPTNSANPRFDNVTTFDISDSFQTTNDFHGADLGFLWEGYRGPWSLEVIGRVGIGNTNQDVTISGRTVRTEGGNSFSDQGGVLALQSNIGSYSRDEFTVLPEISTTLGYAISPRTRFLIGYTFLYWNNVARAGDQVDLAVNPDLIPDVQPTNGPARPAFAFTDTGFWAQGLSLGLEYRW